METTPVDSSTSRPKTDIRIKDVTVFLDPFEGFMKSQHEAEEAAKAKNTGSKDGDGASRLENDRMTWTGKRLRGFNDTKQSDEPSHGEGIGKYLKAALADRATQGEEGTGGFLDEEPESEHVRKKAKAPTGRGGFGNFDTW
jgi:peptidyl-prolyl cis-trans isomerase-like 2